MESAKIDSIQLWPMTRTINELHGYLGLNITGSSLIISGV